MATSARPKKTDAAAQLDARAGDIVDRTRSLFATGARPAEREDAADTVSGLGRVAAELRDALCDGAGRRPGSALALAERLVEVTALQKQLRERVIGLRFQILARIHA